MSKFFLYSVLLWIATLLIAVLGQQEELRLSRRGADDFGTGQGHLATDGGNGLPLRRRVRRRRRLPRNGLLQDQRQEMRDEFEPRGTALHQPHRTGREGDGEHGQGDLPTIKATVLPDEHAVHEALGRAHMAEWQAEAQPQTRRAEGDDDEEGAGQEDLAGAEDPRETQRGATAATTTQEGMTARARGHEEVRDPWLEDEDAGAQGGGATATTRESTLLEDTGAFENFFQHGSSGKPFELFPPVDPSQDESTRFRSPAETFGPSRNDPDGLRRVSECLRFLQLSAHRVGMQFLAFSQNHEDGLLQGVLNCIGTTNRRYVEFGTESGKQCNTRYLREIFGWHGLMMDGGFEDKSIGLHQETVLVEGEESGVVALFAKYKVPKYLDLLSVDTDYYDLFLTDRILRAGYRPRILVHEINRNFFPRESFSVRYDGSTGRWDMQSAYMGCSPQALDRLLKFYGYTFLLLDSSGINGVYLRNDLVDAALLAPLDQFYTGWPSLHGAAQGRTWLYVPPLVDFTDPYWFYSESSPPRPPLSAIRQDPEVIQEAARRQAQRVQLAGTAPGSKAREVVLDHRDAGVQIGWALRHFFEEGKTVHDHTWLSGLP